MASAAQRHECIAPVGHVDLDLVDRGARASRRSVAGCAADLLDFAVDAYAAMSGA